MAQTKRKRRTKHRGTAAGTIESRGRTSRPQSPQDKKKEARAKAREQRLNQQPTWSSAFKRAGIAAGFMGVFLLFTSKGNVAAAIAFAVFAFALYVPAGYYLEIYLWRRRQRKKEQAAR